MPLAALQACLKSPTSRSCTQRYLYEPPPPPLSTCAHPSTTNRQTMQSSKAFAAGVLAYSLATFNGGYLWHIVLFNEQFLNLKTWSRFEDPDASLAMVAVALQAVLVAYMLPIFQRAMGVSGALSGARFGVWVAGLGMSYAIFGHTAKNQVSCLEGFIALEGLYFLLQFPLSCAFVAFAQERVERSAAATRKRAE